MDYNAALRALRRSEGDLIARLQSIQRDHTWLEEALESFPNDLETDDPYPLVANLRCGLWYAPTNRFTASCHFKSTDGHYGTWNFSIKRLNLNIITLLHERGCAFVVDSTRKGKLFPDSFSRTIPIWVAVINRVKGVIPEDAILQAEEFPFSISESELSQIQEKMTGFVNAAGGCGVQWDEIILTRKIEVCTVGWRTDIPRLLCAVDFDNHILFLVSPSDPAEFIPRLPFMYVQGAGDDQESWARGLTPALFWKNKDTLLGLPPIECVDAARQIVSNAELSGHLAHSMAAEIGDDSIPLTTGDNPTSHFLQLHSENVTNLPNLGWHSSNGGEMNVTICPTRASIPFFLEDDELREKATAADIAALRASLKGTIACVDSNAKLERVEDVLRWVGLKCLVVVDGVSVQSWVAGEDDTADLLLVLVREESKRDLEKVLPFALDFAAMQEGGGGGGGVTVSCDSGCGASVAILVALLTKLASPPDEAPTKQAMRNILARVSTYVVSASPSRNLMKQLNRYFVQGPA